MTSPLRVLIVEDSQDHGVLVLRELRRGGFDVTSERVETPAAMRAALDAGPWDVVIADYVLPRFSAPDALKLLQEAGLDLPFVVVSGQVGVDEAVAIMRAGADDYLMKGDLTRLVPAVRRELRARQERREREEAEQEVRPSREFLDHLINALDDPVFAKDEEHRWVFLNDAACAVMGRPREELIGKSDYDLFPKEQADVFWEKDGQVLRSGAGSINEEEITWHGQVHRVSTKKSVFTDPATGKRLITGTIRDITERKRGERERERLISELKAKNAELERFAYTVSHDLKSPLITIQGFLGALEKDTAAGDAERMKDDIARIGGAAAKMQSLLRELLELSRIGRLVNPVTRVPLAALAKQAADELAQTIAHRGARVEVAEGLPEVFGDQARLVQMLGNLIDNAVKFSGDGAGPRVEIGARRSGGETVCFVRDDGIGIEPRYHETVFGLFHQLDPDAPGTGAGLAIARGIAEMHGGRMWVESEGAGRGSTFCFTLPEPRGEQPSDRHEEA
jgi:PAS domain S-box-containing protein